MTPFGMHTSGRTRRKRTARGRSPRDQGAQQGGQGGEDEDQGQGAGEVFEDEQGQRQECPRRCQALSPMAVPLLILSATKLSLLCSLLRFRPQSNCPLPRF